MALPPKHAAAMEAFAVGNSQRKQAFGLPLSPDEVCRRHGAWGRPGGDQLIVIY
jgi:hypothetical protein